MPALSISVLASDLSRLGFLAGWVWFGGWGIGLVGWFAFPVCFVGSFLFGWKLFCLVVVVVVVVVGLCFAWGFFVWVFV